MLKIEKLSVHYGGLAALKEVSLLVQTGELISIVGANGAGKTTLLRAISGAVATQGDVWFQDVNVSSDKSYVRARRGIVHVPQGRHIFGSLSVEENLLVACTYRGSRTSIEKVYELFPALFAKRRQNAGELSGGQQQMVAIGRGIMSAPLLLMLDEPSTGISPTLTDDIFAAILKLHASDRMALVLVEQRATTALEISSRAYVLEQGRIVVQGLSAELRVDDRVRKAYLGV